MTEFPPGRGAPDEGTPVAVIARDAADLDEVVSLIARDAPTAVSVTIPNPATTDHLLGMLRGERIPAAAIVPADVDDRLATVGYQRARGFHHSELADRPVVQGGLGAYLHQLAQGNGVGGNTAHLVQHYTRKPALAQESAVSENLSASLPFLSVLTRTQATPHRVETLRDVLTCLAGQTNSSFELILLPHRVNEEKLGTLTSLLSEFDVDFTARVRVLPVVAPGRSSPLNVGLGAARGSYVAVLDDDDLVLGHWVSSFADLAARCERPAVLRSRGVMQRMEFTDRSGVGYRAWTTGESHWAPTFSVTKQWRENEMPIHTYAVPRAEVLAWGLRWDPDLPVFEDWDFLMRVVNVVGCVSGEEVTAVYRMWPSTHSSLAAVNRADWDPVRESILSRWDDMTWIVPPGTVRQAVAAEVALESSGRLADRAKARAQHLARRHGPALLASPFGRLLRTAYRRSGLRPEDT
ncbi:MAG: glycosyltransferase family A protein [Dermatophilaceae bacterium]